MLKTVELTKSLAVSPAELNSNIIKNIIYLLKQKYEKNCSEDDGLIISIDDILDITNVVSKDSCSVIFNIRFLATVIKPERQTKISFKPSLIIPKGIFGKLFENISLFIPESNLTKQKWSFDSDTFTRENQTVTKESLIEVTITDIKFNVSKYNCICMLH